MKSFLRLLVLLAAGHSSLSAHPHTVIDQQAHLSVGRKQAIVSLFLVPSARQASRLVGYVDSNGDGRISEREKRRFSTNLLQSASLAVNGREVTLKLLDTNFPDKRALASGRGTIKVKATAQIALSKWSKNHVSFDITYNPFTPRWFVQPYYFADIVAARPTVKRSPNSNRIVITV